MTAALAAILLTAIQYITPSAKADIDAFIRFIWAADRCPGVIVNTEKTLEQIEVLGRGQQWDEERVREKILTERRIAESLYMKNEDAFCSNILKLYKSYDPEYLRQTGVID